jgi:4-aminobutyrate aminotransferase
MGAVPDMVALGKGLGGGVIPQAALIVRRDLDVAEDIAIGHYTHEKSPLGAAAALATIETIRREDLVRRAEAIGARAEARLRAMQLDLPEIAAVRRIGAFLGIVLAGPDGAALPALADRVLYEALERGLSFKVGGGNVLTLCPPLTIAEADLELALDILAAALAAAHG